MVGLALTAAACGSSESPVGTDPTLVSTTTATSSPTTATSPPTTAPTTFTTEAYGIEDEPTVEGDAAFIVSEVVFGDDGYVAVTNVGDGTGSLSGFQLCQRPTYFGIGDVTVAAKETVYFTVGATAGLDGQIIEAGSRFGRLRASSGEIGLYSSGSFGSSDAIVSYVEWGQSGHERSAVAVGAGIWAEGNFVVTTDATLGVIMRTVDVPMTSANWAAT